jgi:eukaryotic-like serine/threonine-protein kinase
MVDENEAFEKRIGTVLKGKWTLERLLGVGGMAAVYVGLHKIGRREAIKILHPEIARNKELRARFEQEARAVNRFHHPGAVEIRDIDITEDGAPFLVMELLDGEPLAARAEASTSFDVGEMLRITDAVLDVLAAAHAQGIIHRDIKPDNLFLLRNGGVKVLDFGIARMRQEAGASLHTRTGSTLGTVTYMPPEQVKGLAIDARADLFAVGATMFRLLARRRLHEGNSEAHLLIKMATESVPPLASVAPHLPRNVGLIVDRALAFQAAQRYPDARTMQSDVRDVLRGEPPRAALAFMNSGEFPANAAAAAAGRSSAAFDPPTRAPAPSGDPATRAEWAAAPISTPAVSIRTSGAPVSGDAATMMVIPSMSALIDPRSVARPPPGWQGPDSVPATIVRPPGADAPTSTGPSHQALWIAAAAAGVFLFLGIALIAALFHGHDTDAGSTSAIPPAPRIGGPANNKDDDKSRKAASSDQAWCGGGDCDFECDSRCDMACTGGRCNIEVKPKAKVTCAGSGECALWCQDDCAVKCPGEASCIVHCKPGKRCTMDVCPSGAKTCPNGMLVCDRKCPS